MDSAEDTSKFRTGQLQAALDHLAARRWRMAEVQCRVLLAVDPTDVEAILILGLAIAASGEATRAAPLLNRVRRERPTHADPCRDFANMEPRVPRALVTRQYRACLRLALHSVRLRHDFASYLLENSAPDGALTVLRETPESAITCNLRGMALAETGKFKEATRCFETAAKLDPGFPGGWSNLGMMLKIEGKFDEALAAYDRAVALASDDPRIKVDRAITLLHAGRWEEGWGDYGKWSGWPGSVAISQAPPLPPVTDARLDSVRILVRHDEGFGDTLQFSRYLPLLTRLGATVIAVVPPPLVRLLSRMPEISIMQSGDAALPPHDFQCSFSSLPRVFGTTTENVPNAPWLEADPELVGAWSARLPNDGLRVGLVWSGRARAWLQGFTSIDRRRSTGLAAFAPLVSVRGVRFVSLQAGTAAAQGQEPPAGMELTDPMDAVHDFADTAAITANLDVVISVDTSVAHLAGAMGKPVFLLDRYDSCWRWLHGRTDSPWYPSMTIFRQPRPGDWSTVMHRVASALGAVGLARSAQAEMPRPAILATAA